MFKNTRLALVLGFAAAAGCGAGAEESSGSAAEVSTGSEAAAPATEVAVIARYEGMLAEAMPMVIEIDDAGGGTVTYPDSGRSFTLSDCVGSGPTLTCQIAGNGVTGDIELTHREGGTDGRVRQDTDGEWAEFSADQVDL